MKRICTDQGLKDFFADGKPHHVEEIETRFKVSRIVVYREMKRLGAFRSINETGFYLLQRDRDNRVWPHKYRNLRLINFNYYQKYNLILIFLTKEYYRVKVFHVTNAFLLTI